jgi:hypothetical protein
LKIGAAFYRYVYIYILSFEEFLREGPILLRVEEFTTCHYLKFFLLAGPDANSSELALVGIKDMNMIL